MHRRLIPAALTGAVVLVAAGFLVGRPPILDPPSVSGSSTPGAVAAASHAPPATSSPALPGSTPSVDPSPGPSFRPRVGPTASAALAARLQEALDELRAAHGIPGVSASIVFPDGTAWTGVSGLADVGAGVKVRPDTAFAVGSISKTFTAALILALSAEGRLSLSDAASRYLPGVEAVGSVTIRQLLDHTSGLRDYLIDARFDRALRARPDRAWLPLRALAYAGKPYFPPGTGFHYSNTNYLLLGLIAERVGGAPLAVQLRTRFLDPLGLSRTYDQAVEQPRGPTAHGYRFAGAARSLPPIDVTDGDGMMPFRSVVTAAEGAGSLAATSLDVARWSSALYGGRVLDRSSLALMLAAVDRGAGYAPGPYGLGVQSVQVGRFGSWGHSGRLLGFRAVTRYLPADGIAIGVLTNQTRVDPGVILAELARIADPPPGPCRLCARAS